MCPTGECRNLQNLQNPQKIYSSPDLGSVNDSTTREVSKVTGLDFDLIAAAVELIESELNRDLTKIQLSRDDQEERCLCILQREKVAYEPQSSVFRPKSLTLLGSGGGQICPHHHVFACTRARMHPNMLIFFYFS